MKINLTIRAPETISQDMGIEKLINLLLVNMMLVLKKNVCFPDVVGELLVQLLLQVCGSTSRMLEL